MSAALHRMDDEIFLVWVKVQQIILLNILIFEIYIASLTCSRVIEVTGDIDLRNSFELIAQASIIITTVSFDNHQ